MSRLRSSLLVIAPALLAVLAGAAISAPDKYTVQVPGGLAFAEFRGYEAWQVISLSQSGEVFAVILGNPAMIEAYQAGIPGNGKPFPDGAKMAKIHWVPTTMEDAPGQPAVPGTLHDVDFMVKDATRFADSGGWSAAVAGVNVSAAASYLKAPYPHPPLSANRALSFTMKSMSCRAPATIVGDGASSLVFAVQWIFAILAPSGKGLPLPGMPAW